jgi:hypothetical protein
MGLLGKLKKKSNNEDKSKSVQLESESDTDVVDDDTEGENGEFTLELDDSIVDESLEDVLKLDSSDDESGEAEAPAAKKDDDAFSDDLMDIFEDDAETGPDLEALSDYLEDIDMESLLAQAQHVSARLRGL